MSLCRNIRRVSYTLSSDYLGVLASILAVALCKFPYTSLRDAWFLALSLTKCLGCPRFGWVVACSQQLGRNGGVVEHEREVSM